MQFVPDQIFANISNIRFQIEGRDHKNLTRKQSKIYFTFGSRSSSNTVILQKNV